MLNFSEKCYLMSAALQFVVYADWSPLPTAPSRKEILENNHRRSWQSGCLPEMNWRVILCVLWFGSRFGADRFPSNGSEQNYLPGHSCNRFPYQALLQANQIKNKQIWWPEIKLVNWNVRTNKINKTIVLVSLRSKIPAKRGVRTANRREICRVAIAEDKHTLEFTVF